MYQHPEQHELILVELPKNFDRRELMNVRTIDELEKLTHRVTPSIEQDLIGRLQVYTEDKDNWEVEPKIKKIYKYTKNTRNDVEQVDKNYRQVKIRTLKKQ